MITIMRAGPLTSVQDLGRPGYRHLGVALGGALDPLALTVANRLVGNSADAAGLEITLGPTTLRFTQPTRIALAGADFGATLDDVPIFSWWSVPVAAGQTLTLRSGRRFMRAYLAVAGGIDVPALLGSRSTDLQAGFGGFHGRALRDGDSLAVGQPHYALAHDAPPFGVKPPWWCRLAPPEPVDAAPRGRPQSETMLIRVLPGTEYAEFTAAAHEAFWSSDWSITPNSNRMGYRLSGPSLERKALPDLGSHAVFPGTIQVPPGGQPIVLLSDAQTAGGYPKIGAVASADLWRLAQARLGTTVRFVHCTLDEARNAQRELQRYMQQIDGAISLQTGAGRRAAPAPQPTAPAAAQKAEKQPCT